jgi:hypothetical protein
MTGSEAYYSVIQYCPNRFRAEGVNVGVVLLAPHAQSIRARMTSNHSRVRKMFGTSGSAIESLKLAKRAMESRINSLNHEIHSVEDLRSFIGTRANDLRLIEPRLVKVTDFEGELDRLYLELVETEMASGAVGALELAEVLPPKLSEVFYRLSASHRIWSPGKVTVPVRKRRLDIPYAYQNGTVNLVKPFLFPRGKRAEKEAANLAIDGDLIQKHLMEGKQHRLIVVSTQEDDALAHELTEHVEPLFRHYSVRLVRPAQAEQFANEVEKQAH